MQRPLTPFLIAGLILPPRSERVLEPIFKQISRKIWNRHKKSFARLSESEGVLYLIDPIDLPFVIGLRMETDGPTVKLASHDIGGATATIRGSLLALAQLAEGEIDGDALFFSRKLEIEGDTEAVVALRNALDDADINLIEEFATRFGPFGPPVRKASAFALRLGTKAQEDLQTLQKAILAPAASRLQAQSLYLETLEEKIEHAERRLRKTSSGAR